MSWWHSSDCNNNLITTNLCYGLLLDLLILLQFVDIVTRAFRSRWSNAGHGPLVLVTLQIVGTYRLYQLRVEHKYQRVIIISEKSSNMYDNHRKKRHLMKLLVPHCCSHSRKLGRLSSSLSYIMRVYKSIFYLKSFFHYRIHQLVFI